MLKFWPRLTKRRLFGTLAFVVAMFVLIGALGQWWLTHSEPYELGREAVGRALNASKDSVALDRLASFEVSEGEFHGHANFVLCGLSHKCFTVIAKKRDARWTVVDLVKRQ